ncbi:MULTISPECIES: TIGR01777 family oxidoreductase [Pseudoalteromonas]|uniref:TIGR01777 family oxidoreductase n=1 Tax=Pseudoalteromonas obscura TaxID=3048491 RepID=A0ABT7ES33_9GAMM|nr:MULTISPECIES: TIGR01777 family oxidoreductase [Pseudoalteromonas]MBQ4835449.1 TIGR01777 family oxidoreductase [Pseudoalteromonas luteoviolacea]MDK2597871.1 TIGR01777 family oxidoreductase [Pseudoalteromonas sp. P94(2023)]
MNILITGGTGLIGQELCKFLVNKYNLVILTRNELKARHLLGQIGQNSRFVACLSEVDFNDIDIIINLAGEPIADKRWSDKQKQAIIQSRVGITEQIAAYVNAAHNRPHTFISGSAIGFYGRQPADVAVDESYDNPYNEFSHQLCRDWEQAALKTKSEQTRVCLLRTGVVLSRRGGALKKMLPAFSWGMGGPMASGEQMMSWIHIDDMIQLILFLIRHDELEGAFNATAPNPVSNKEFSDCLATVLNRPAFFWLPESFLKWAFGEMSDILIYGQKVIPKKALDANYRFRYQSLEEALKQIMH